MLFTQIKKIAATENKREVGRGEGRGREGGLGQERAGKDGGRK